jgi:glycosyltransferase involved in cell wall biosynthesis
LVFYFKQEKICVVEIIHLILGKANPERMNGVNKVVFQLASQQAAAGRKVAVWGITKDTTHNYGARNFETQLFKAAAVPFILDNTLKQALLAKKSQIVVHLHGGWIPTYASLSAFLLRHNIPYILTPHGAYNTIAMQRSAWTKKIYFHLFEKKLLSGASRIHAIGQSEMKGLEAIFPNQKSYLQPYGYIGPDIALVDHPESSAFIIGFVGRLDIYTKGLDLLLEAFEAFQYLHSNAQLWIVGDSKERAELEQMVAQRQIQDKVVFWGSKFGKEKFDLMQQMDVFAHPSRNEGLPASVLEAAQLGIPCIVSQATNMASYIETYHAGIAVADEDVDGLVRGMETLIGLKANDHRKIGLNAQKMVKEAFGWDHIVPAFDQLYQTA